MTRTTKPTDDVDAEKCVLGSCLISREALDRAVETLTVTDFHNEGHRATFAAMLACVAAGQEVDEVTVSEQMRLECTLVKAGGLAGIADLARNTPTSAHVRAYARILKQRSMRRALMGAALAIHAEAKDGDDDAEAILERAQKAITDLTPVARNGHESAGELMPATWNRLEAISNRGTTVTGTPTGFDDWDEMTSGLQRTDLIVVAGVTSSGKTSFALNIAANVAVTQKVTTVIFSMEMSKQQLMDRLVAQVAGVDATRMRKGKLTPEDWSKMAKVAPAISEAPLIIDDNGGITTLDIRTVCRRIIRQRGPLGLIVVDYLTQMRPRRRHDNRAQEVSENVRDIKTIAKELDCPVILIAQLNRDLAKRVNKRPTLNDLKESGEIEQAADVVAFVYRDAVYTKDKTDDAAEVEIAKQRTGPTGTIHLRFVETLTQFQNLTTKALPPNTADNPDERTAQRGAA